jgi:hypothetical protein
VRQFLEGLGISHNDVFDMHVGVWSVEISMYATNEEGRRFPALDGKGAAEHTISIPFSGSWDKPSVDAEQSDGRCPVRRNLQPGGRCLRDADHKDDHHYSQV